MMNAPIQTIHRLPPASRVPRHHFADRLHGRMRPCRNHNRRSRRRRAHADRYLGSVPVRLRLFHPGPDGLPFHLIRHQAFPIQSNRQESQPHRVSLLFRQYPEPTGCRSALPRLASIRTQTYLGFRTYLEPRPVFSGRCAWPVPGSRFQLTQYWVYWLPLLSSPPLPPLRKRSSPTPPRPTFPKPPTCTAWTPSSATWTRTATWTSSSPWRAAPTGSTSMTVRPNSPGSRTPFPPPPPMARIWPWRISTGTATWTWFSSWRTEASTSTTWATARARSKTSASASRPARPTAWKPPT